MVALRKQVGALKGIGDSERFTMSHESRSRGYERGPGPSGLVVGTAGGPQFVVRDWVLYPASLADIEPLWGEYDYLYFSGRDAWFYQATRQDLRRAGLTPRGLLDPVHAKLSELPDFRWLVQNRPRLVAQAAVLREKIRGRIDSPKRLSDLVSFGY